MYYPIEKIMAKLTDTIININTGTIINPKHINICLLSIPLTGRYTLEPNSA